LPGPAAGIHPGLESFDFPQYAYGISRCGALAARLAIPAITVMELGVAGGNGLVEMQRLSATAAAAGGVRIMPVGFDLGSGMPEPVDYRDMSYIWRPGFFKMDEELLRSRLTSARLELGDIVETGPAFMRSGPAPIGFISFDLDYYSSTVAAMVALLEETADRYLPRVMCYFDDTVGPHEELHSEFTGELLAIREFNDGHKTRKIGKINGLRYKLPGVDGPWVEGMYVLHIFDHPKYNDYVYPAVDRQFPLDR